MIAGSASPLLPVPDDGYGHTLRTLWSLDPAVHFLNHGSYGAAPHHVLAAQSQWRDALEREPVRFMADELPAALRAAGARLAGFVGATPSRLALVENATAPRPRSSGIAPAEMFASMVTLPLPVDEPGTREVAMGWRAKLLREHSIEVPIFAIDGRLWVRISAQVYNELSDYEALARAFS